MRWWGDWCHLLDHLQSLTSWKVPIFELLLPEVGGGGVHKQRRAT